MSTRQPQMPRKPPHEGLADDEDRLPRHPIKWLQLMVVAAVVGVITGVVATAFRVTLNHIAELRDTVALFAHLHLPPWIGWLLPVAFCSAGAGIGSWMTQRLAPHTAGSGIPRIEAVLRAHLRPAGPLILPVKFFGGLLSIGSGLLMGREGPTVQMGGTIGRLISNGLRRFVPEPWTLIAAGAGAGLAAAFNAPLSAALFVSEELLHRFSARIFSATLVACIAATLVYRWWMGNVPDFVVAPLTNVHAGVLPEYLLLGAITGVLGVGFNITVMQTLSLFDHTLWCRRGLKGAVIGAVVGIAMWFSPTLAGGGEELAQRTITGHYTFGILFGLIAVRFVLTMASYATGAPGGLFAPLLALGAMVGNGFAMSFTTFRHGTLDQSSFAIVAMAALFTAIVRSPFTGVVLLLEMTGRWTLILPMMAASICAYAIPELLGNPPIYDSLRERDEIVEKRAVRKDEVVP